MFQELSVNTLLCSILTLGLTTSADTLADQKRYYSPPTSIDYPTRVYWGDTHIHTTMSVDAAGLGNINVTPDVAYRFASGRTVRGHNGETFKLRRPLDFLAITDHAINMDVMVHMFARDPLVLNTKTGREWRKIWDKIGWSVQDKLTTESFKEWQKMHKIFDWGVPPKEPAAFFWKSWMNDNVADETFRQSVWDEVCENADEYNQPGIFTAFIGYEWTPPAIAPSAAIHRNVIFEGNKTKACQVLPFSWKDSADVEKLWAYLEDYERKTGDNVLAIPHNGNMSQGNLFTPFKYDKQPLDLDYLNARRRWEPLVEVTQIKGDSESHPLLSPTDEFANFETWSFRADPSLEGEQVQYEYAREGLKLGLNHEAKSGVNPYKFGMIGASDAHSGLSAVAEDNYSGKWSLYEPSKHRAIETWWHSASGLAAVWSTGNTRSEIFSAMKRRETYATTGTRISVRFFGGWHFEHSDASDNRFADIGYREGVPMGGDLTAGPENGAPKFLILVLKDPDGANLDRVQVIKGWRDLAGELYEQVYDVALSDGRVVGPDGKVSPVENTVNVEDASYTNSVGEVEFALMWEDPDFDAKHAAFYYVRVLEIPTPRWTAYDAAHYGTLDKIPDEAPMVIQERAYTSPIWYTP